MPTPSLLIVPARFKSGRLYSQIPTSGGDFTVTRALGTATRVNASGLIESVASGIPRLDYYASGGTVGCPALLVEPSGSNGILNSANTTTNWTLGAKLTSGAIDVMGVSGNNIGIALSGSGIGSADGRFVRFTNNVALASGSTFTVSFLLKKTGSHTIGGYQLTMSSGVIGSGFDVSGSFASGSNVDTAPTTNRIRRVEQYGTDVFRCSETFTMTAAATGTHLAFGPVSTVLVSTNSAVGTAMGFAAPQIELGSIPTSFIPTTSAAVTRNGDLISVSGAVSGSIGQTQGTIYCEFAYFGQPVIRSGPVYLRQAASRGLSINYSPSDSPSGISFISRNDIGSTLITIVSGAFQIGTYYKIAIGYDAANTAAGGSQASGVVAYVNGVQTAIGLLRVPDAAGLTEFRMYGANSGTDAEAFNGRIRAAALYTTRLTDAQLAALTT